MLRYYEIITKLKEHGFNNIEIERFIYDVKDRRFNNFMKEMIDIIIDLVDDETKNEINIYYNNHNEANEDSVEQFNKYVSEFLTDNINDFKKLIKTDTFNHRFLKISNLMNKVGKELVDDFYDKYYNSIRKYLIVNNNFNTKLYQQLMDIPYLRHSVKYDIITEEFLLSLPKKIVMQYFNYVIKKEDRNHTKEYYKYICSFYDEKYKGEWKDISIFLPIFYEKGDYKFILKCLTVLLPYKIKYLVSGMINYDKNYVTNFKKYLPVLKAMLNEFINSNEYVTSNVDLIYDIIIPLTPYLIFGDDNFNKLVENVGEGSFNFELKDDKIKINFINE